MDRRLGYFLIFIGIVLLFSPSLAPIFGATLIVYDPAQVWHNWTPKADTSDQPYRYIPNTALVFRATILRQTPSWQLPANCHRYTLEVIIRQGFSETGSIVRNMSVVGLAIDEQLSGLGYWYCYNHIPLTHSFSSIGQYLVVWRLRVYDDNNNFIGIIENPKRTYIVIQNLPDGYFSINGQRVTESTTLVLPINTAMNIEFTATQAPESITRVRVDIKRGTTSVFAQDLSKVSTNTWRTSWTPNQAGTYTIEGYFFAGGNDPIRRMSIVATIGPPGGGDGSGMGSLSPLQLIGILLIVTGTYISFFQRRRRRW